MKDNRKDVIAVADDDDGWGEVDTKIDASKVDY